MKSSRWTVPLWFYGETWSSFWTSFWVSLWIALTTGGRLVFGLLGAARLMLHGTLAVSLGTLLASCLHGNQLFALCPHWRIQFIYFMECGQMSHGLLEPLVWIFDGAAVVQNFNGRFGLNKSIVLEPLPDQHTMDGIPAAFDDLAVGISTNEWDCPSLTGDWLLHGIGGWLLNAQMAGCLWLPLEPR